MFLLILTVAAAEVAVGLGLVLSVPNLLGNWLGGWLFRPEYERLYRGAAYLAMGRRRA